MVLVIGASLGSILLRAQQQDVPVRFTNIAPEAGITFKHENGASPQKYMPETMAGGSIIFDYNNDGWPDIFFVNGGSFTDKQKAAGARHRLYRNNKDGTFTDVTAGIGHRSIRLWNGRLFRRLRQRRLARPLYHQLRGQ